MTSIQWLFNKLWEEPKDKFEWHSIFEQAKEMYYKELMGSMQRGMELQEKENKRIGFRERNGLLELPNVSNYCDCEPQAYYQWEMEENKCNKCNKKIYTEEQFQSLKQPK